MNRIVMEEVSKQYRGPLISEPLKNICLTVESGDFISITGDSGIGKSTLLYVLGGLIRPTGGSVYYNGRSIATFCQREIDQFRASVVSVILQDFQFIQALTLRDNLRIVAGAGKKDRNIRDVENKVEEYLERLKLHDRRNFLPSRLSGGQKRRAMVLSGVLRDAQFILADEPTNDTDKNMGEEIIKILLEERKKGKALVLVSHNREIADLTHKEYTLTEGKLRKINSKEDKV